MAITMVIPDASVFLQAIIAISNFAGLTMSVGWNNASFVLSSDGRVGGTIFIVLDGRQINLSSDEHAFSFEVIAMDFIRMFDYIPLTCRSSLRIEIDQSTSRFLVHSDVDNCTLFFTVKAGGDERQMEIEGRSTTIGPQFEFFLGGNSSFRLPVVEYWRTVYLVHNNVRHVRVILRATEVSFAAESFLSLGNVDYSRFLTRYNGLSGIRLENGVSYSRFYLATVQVDSYYWASYSSQTVTITQMGNGSDIRFHLGIGYIAYRFL